jgi:hypothetical protein
MAAMHSELRTAVRVAKRLRQAEERLDHARREFYAAVRAAHAAGVSLSEIARTLGVTRQAAQGWIKRSP